MRVCPNCAEVVENREAVKCPDCKSQMPLHIRQAVEKRKADATAAKDIGPKGAVRVLPPIPQDAAPTGMMPYLKNGALLGFLNTVLILPPLFLLYLFTAPAAEFMILSKFEQHRQAGYKAMAAITFAGNVVFAVLLSILGAILLLVLVLMKNQFEPAQLVIAAVGIPILAIISFLYQLVIGSVYVFLRKRDEEPEVE